MSAFLFRVPSVTRKLIVTFGLSAGGAIVGAAAGAVASLLALVVGRVIVSIFDLWVLAIPATIGAFLGFVLTPIVAWMLLRRVPLGRAFLGLAGGTIAGGVLGFFFPYEWDPIEGAVVAAVVGFCVAALVLRWLASRRKELPAG